MWHAATTTKRLEDLALRQRCCRSAPVKCHLGGKVSHRVCATRHPWPDRAVNLSACLNDVPTASITPDARINNHYVLSAQVKYQTRLFGA